MTIVQQPDSLSFCGNLKDFIITGESELSFSLYSGSTILIAETYTAYNNKIIIPCKKVIDYLPAGYRCFCTNKGCTGF